MKRLAHIFGPSILGLSACFIACTKAGPLAKESDALRIYVRETGDKCESQGMTFLCSEFPAAISEALKGKYGCRFEVVARGNPQYEAFQAFVEGLQKAGCKIGTVNLSSRPIE
jgi:hypothetical protein